LLNTDWNIAASAQICGIPGLINLTLTVNIMKKSALKRFLFLFGFLLTSLIVSAQSDGMSHIPDRQDTCLSELKNPFKKVFHLELRTMPSHPHHKSFFVR